MQRISNKLETQEFHNYATRFAYNRNTCIHFLKQNDEFQVLLRRLDGSLGYFVRSLTSLLEVKESGLEGKIAENDSNSQ